jgi:hypothetical protein
VNGRSSCSSSRTREFWFCETNDWSSSWLRSDFHRLFGFGADAADFHRDLLDVALQALAGFASSSSRRSLTRAGWWKYAAA